MIYLHRLESVAHIKIFKDMEDISLNKTDEKCNAPEE